MSNNTSVLSQLAASVLLVNKTTTSISNSAKDDDSAEFLAQAKGGDAKARKVTVPKFPKGHDAEYKACVQALGALNSYFDEKTIAFGSGAGKTKGGAAKAKGDRAVHVSELAKGFEQRINVLKGELDSKRTALANALPRIKAGIQADPDVGPAWVEDKFPTYDEVMGSFKWELIGPKPIASVRELEGLPASDEWLGEIRDRMEADAVKQVQFAQQRLAQELAGYVQNLAEQTGKLVEWESIPTEKREGKAPRIFSTLTQNVNAAVEKIKTYAIPGTPEGDKLLALAERALEELEVDRIEAEDLKDNVPLARSTSERAAALAEAIENWHLEAAVGQHTPEPPVPEDAAPVWVPPVPEEEEDAAPVF